MLVSTVVFFLWITTVYASESRSEFSKQYLNTNYTPLIVETRPMTSSYVSSKVTCLAACLNVNDCSLAVFNKISKQCAQYNLFPFVDKELLPDNNIVVFAFQPKIQLLPSVSNTSWLITRLNTTNLVKRISVPYARSLGMDIFGYLLTLETFSATTYVDRYDRTSLTLVKRTALSIPYTTMAILTYYNNMIFIGGPNNTVFIFDYINFTLLANVTCGSNLDQPRNIIFMESLKTMIVISYNNNKIVYFRINSPTNYTCLNSTSLAGGPQALSKINDTFFYATAYQTLGIYSYQFNGQTWIQSLFVNVSQTTGLSGIKVSYLQVDSSQRRWVTLPYYGLAIYDQWGTFLGKWKIGTNPFDIFISNDYRVIIAENGNSTLSSYDPQIHT